ncbi:TPA: hypothetical protein MDN85_003494 [Klebsiella pneumoniae]|nr:hypothetical protein [Klebsiella pneumoniae]HBV0926994.1 hypothetical protein [Klebsiella pneumoniae]
MTTDITELAQSHELLIANGQQTADLLRHLADNEIDSDYFAVVSECEGYGKETDAELSITEFALRAAGYVDALVEALEEEQAENAAGVAGMAESYETIISMLRSRIAELESRTVTVENLQESTYRAGLTAGWNLGLANNNEGFNKCLAAHADGIKVEAE